MPLAPEIYNALNAWAASVVAQAKMNLVKGKKNATKDLYNSIHYKVMPDGEVEFFYDDAGDFVESGRKKYPDRGVNPEGKFLSNIIRWAQVKGLKQFRNKKGKFISNKSRGYLIAMSINKRGIKAFPFFSSALDKAMNDYYYRLEQAIADAIEHDLEAIQEIQSKI